MIRAETDGCWSYAAKFAKDGKDASYDELSIAHVILSMAATVAETLSLVDRSNVGENEVEDVGLGWVEEKKPRQPGNWEKMGGRNVGPFRGKWQLYRTPTRILWSWQDSFLLSGGF